MREHEAGFTLLEVLVALAILGIAVVTVFQLASQSLRLITRSAEHQHAALLADRVARALPDAREGVDSGEEGPYAWERRVTRVAVPEELSPQRGAQPALMSVSVTVRWGRSQAFEVATLRAVAVAEPPR